MDNDIRCDKAGMKHYGRRCNWKKYFEIMDKEIQETMHDKTENLKRNLRIKLMKQKKITLS